MHIHELCTGFYSTSGAFDLYGCSGTNVVCVTFSNDIYVFCISYNVSINVIHKVLYHTCMLFISNRL